MTTAEDDIEIDLSDHEPPEALSELCGITDEIILAVVRSSIETIQQQVDLEKQQRDALEQELARKAAEAAEAEAGKGKGIAEPEVGPIIPNVVITSATGKAQKSSRFGIRRIINHLRDRSGDGSARRAAGAARPSSEDGSSPSALTRLIYKHARSSISSEEVVEGDTRTVECVSCLEDILRKEAIKAPCHYYCTECFEQLITIALDNEEQWPPKCCLNQIPERLIANKLPKALVQQYREKAEEFRIPVDKRLYCVEPDCGEWMRKVNRAAGTARCSKGHVMCINCRNPAHPQDQDCPEDNDRLLADQLAQEEGWRRCISCKILVEHREACQHMTCRCGAEFCYVCGLRWRTCDCSMAQLEQLKAAAEARRAERQAREEAEESWLREALRAIEAAQREQEKQRRAEQARLREAKYAALRSALLRLNELQEVMLKETHTTEAVEAGTQALSRREELTNKHKEEREALQVAAATKIADAELEWQRDLRARALWSCQLEEEYRAAQTAFWVEFKGGEKRMDRLIYEYRYENHARYQKWCSWRDKEMEHFRWKVGEEHAVGEELLDRAMSKFEQEVGEQELGLRKKRGTEQRWFDLVVSERIRLLAELEMDEIETDGSWDDEPAVGIAI